MCRVINVAIESIEWLAILTGVAIFGYAFTHLAHGQTTQPATQPATQPIHRIIKTLRAGDDIAQALATSPPNYEYHLADKSAWKVKGSPTITAANVALIGNGNALVFTASPGGSTGIEIKAPGFEIGGFTITGASNMWLLRVDAPSCYVHDIRYDRIDTFASLGESGDDAHFARCTGGMNVGAYSIYCGGADGLLVEDFDAPNSIGEVPLRFSAGTSGRWPCHARILRSRFDTQGAFGKQAVEVRNASDIHFQSCSIKSARVGQVAGARNCDNIEFDACTFSSDPINAQLGVMSGSGAVSVHDCFFTVGPPVLVPITVSGIGSDVQCQNCMVSYLPSITPAQRRYTPDHEPALYAKGGSFYAGEGTGVLQIPAPATKPATQPTTQHK